MRHAGISILDTQKNPFGDTDIWYKEVRKIKKNWKNYVVFEDIETRDSFRIMEDFAHSLDNNRLRESLLDILQMKKPFANFKWKIDNSGEYRQRWFAFRDQRYFDWVKEQIAMFNRSEDNDDTDDTDEVE
ncbi:MAG: hypothetical protein HYV28_02315 [Ignavibacteriales bacterium]|nr:hypothetical protein [Ignavibacteriales bacterium]